MRVVTLLGAVVVLALGTTSCNRSSGMHARGETVGGEARVDETHREAEGERKGKMEGREPSEVREAEAEIEEGEGRSRRILDNPMYRQLNVLDTPNPTGP